MKRALQSLALSAFVFLAPSAVAATIIVDDDGGAGVNFTDIQPAIDFASVGDVILVHPGSYSNFTLAKGLTILGLAPGVQIAEGSRISLLPATDIVVLADLQPKDLRVLSSAGTVVLDSIDFNTSFPATSLPQYLLVDQSDDVRIRNSAVPSNQGNARSALVGSNSRVEVSQSLLQADHGVDSTCGLAGPGGSGAELTGGRTHFSLSSVFGGEGGGNTSTCGSFCGQGAGDGGPGVFVSAGELFLMGLPADLIKGGMTGVAEICLCDGFGGTGLSAGLGSFSRFSGLTIEGGDALSDCLSHAGVPIAGPGAVAFASPPDPVLDFLGDPAPGAVIRWTIYGEVGAQAILYLGRFPVVTPTGGSVIEILTTTERSFDLGPIPAQGFVSQTIVVPPHLTQGFTFYSQAEVIVGGTTIKRTNSIPVVVR